LEQADGPLSLKELAQRAGMSASKAHFYMVSFKRVRLVTQYEDTGHYALGRYALDLGLSALRRLDLVEVSREPMRTLSSQIGESVFLSVWGNHGPTIVFKVDGPRRIPMTLQIGYVLPLLKSATGRIFLSYLPTQQTAAYLRDEVAALAPAVRKALDAEKLKQRVREHQLAETDSLLNGCIVADLESPGRIGRCHHHHLAKRKSECVYPTQHRVFARHRAYIIAFARRARLTRAGFESVLEGRIDLGRRVASRLDTRHWWAERD
jgi:DNA-binding IclR family transcriptional regulator